MPVFFSAESLINSDFEGCERKNIKNTFKKVWLKTILPYFCTPFKKGEG